MDKVRLEFGGGIVLRNRWLKRSAVLIEGQRLKFDTAYESKEEQVIYAICEYVK